MADIIQLRAGTALAWTTANTLLAQAEMGFETDTKRIKVGDGVTAWNSLNYLPAPQTTKEVVGDTTGFGLTITDTVADPGSLPSAATHMFEHYTVTSTGTAWFSNGTIWYDTHLDPANITNLPAYTDGQDVRIVAGTENNWLPVVKLRSSNPSGSERVFVSMERGAFGITNAYDVSTAGKENSLFAVFCDNWTAQDNINRYASSGTSFILVPRGGATFVCNYRDADVDNWVPLDSNLASTFIGKGYSADGWGNDVIKSANGFFERFSLSETEYQWLVGQYSGVQVLNAGTGNYTATMKDQNKLFVMDGFVGDFIMPNIGSGFTCRILIGWGSQGSTINFTAFEADGTTPTRFDMPDPSLNSGNTSPWLFNSASAGVGTAPHDLMLTLTDNGGHYELSSQDFLNWMKGMLAWDKVDKTQSSLQSIKDLRNRNYVTEQQLIDSVTDPVGSNTFGTLGQAQLNNCVIVMPDLTADRTLWFSYDRFSNNTIMHISHGDSIGSGFSVTLRPDWDFVYAEGTTQATIGGSSSIVLLPQDWITVARGDSGGSTADLKVIAASRPELMGHAQLYHSHQAGIEGEPTITDNTNGTFNVATGDCWFYTDATQDKTVMYAMAATSNLTPTDDVTGYVCADRNSKAWVILNSVASIDYLQYIPYFKVIKRTGSNNMHFQKITHQAHGGMELEIQRELACGEYQRELGTFESISVDASLNITVSGGGVWAARRRYAIPAVSTATRQFKCVNTGSGWTITSNTSPVINNTQYNGGSGLVTLTDNYWTINYLYRGIEDQDHIYTVYGTQEFASKELAQASSYVGTLPELISAHAMLIGRVIVQKGATANFICESSYTTVFAASASISDHGQLIGLGDDDHPQYQLGTKSNCSGLMYAFDSTVGGNPAVGNVRVGNGTLTTATLLHISETDAGGQAVDPLLDSLVVPGCWIKLYDRANPTTNYHWYKTTGSFASTGSPLYDPVPVAWQFGGGTFANTAALDVVIDLIPAITVPAIGADKQIAYNDGGTMAGDADLIWDKTTNHLEIGLSGGQGAVCLVANTNDEVAEPGELVVYAKTIGGRVMPKWVGPSGVDTPFQSSIAMNRHMLCCSTGTAYNYIGCSTRTDTGGTSTQTAMTTGSIKNQLSHVVHATGTTTNTICYSRHAAGDMSCYLGNAANMGGFFFVMRFGIQALGSGNIAFFGLSPRITPTFGANLNTYVNIAGVGYQANTENWFLVQNSGSGTGTLTDLGATMALSTSNAMELVMFAAPNASTITYRLTDLTNNVKVEGTINSRPPAVNTLLTPMTWVSNNASTTSCQIWVNKYSIETDY